MTKSFTYGRAALVAGAFLIGGAGAAMAQQTPATPAPAAAAPAATAPAGGAMKPGMAMPSAPSVPAPGKTGPAAVPSSTTMPMDSHKQAAEVGNPTFPNAIDGKYSSLKPAKAIQQTCLAQYKANKSDPASGTNGGLKWIQKGGGYYSECSKHLKMAAKQ
ncbi:hypothetical protein [Rhizosaccharibacter radicis]|uniref:Uncharacterized protein n=1 Tax=Rhizosaccharibacter radicis TaxID=2782605 RepID=A0ABT1VTW6_9PROT|nr:hypothetical protein [Acetobacteraceae bacterium KSS12]